MPTAKRKPKPKPKAKPDDKQIPPRRVGQQPTQFKKKHRGNGSDEDFGRAIFGESSADEHDDD